MAASRWTTARRSQGSVQIRRETLEAGIGLRRAGSRSIVRAHAHMPRCRRTISPAAGVRRQRLRPAWRHAAARTAPTWLATVLDAGFGLAVVIAAVFFPPIARSIVLGCTSRPNSLLDQFRQFARPDRLARDSCVLRKASTSLWSLCGPRGPRFLGTSPAMPASSKSAFAW